MKLLTLSESCLNVGYGIHPQLAAAEADHHTSAYTFVPSIHPLSLTLATSFSSIVKHKHANCGILLTPPVFCALTHALCLSMEKQRL